MAALTSAGPVARDQMPGPPAPPRVSIGYASYLAAKIDVLAGDTVAWHNDSVRRHTVTDDGGGYDSDKIPTGDDFAHRFERVGAFPYHCRLHAGIQGEVDAWELLLERPAAPAEAGRPFRLSGRAALAPGAAVSIQADDGSGAGVRPVAATTTGSDGGFAAVVSPDSTASYRAVAGDAASPPVELLVLNHSISAAAGTARKSSVVSVEVTPPDPGATIVLQLNLREHFGCWPVARAARPQFARPLRATAESACVGACPPHALGRCDGARDERTGSCRPGRTSPAPLSGTTMRGVDERARLDGRCPEDGDRR